MADLEELIERSARSICIAAGYEPEQWADNEDLRNRCLKYAKVAILAYESAKQKGEAEGLIELAAACPTIVKAGKKLTADRVTGKVVVGCYGDVPAIEFKRLAAMLSAGGEG